MLPPPFACPTCGGSIRDDGTCGVCSAITLASSLLEKGCSWCRKTHLRDQQMEAGWFSFWMEERIQMPMGRQPGVICADCWNQSHTLPAREQDAFIRVVHGLPRDAVVQGARPSPSPTQG